MFSALMRSWTKVDFREVEEAGSGAELVSMASFPWSNN
jgi:hypothetical protein